MGILRVDVWLTFSQMVFFQETTEKSSFSSYIQIKLFNSMSYFLALYAYIFIGEKLPIWFNLIYSCENMCIMLRTAYVKKILKSFWKILIQAGKNFLTRFCRSFLKLITYLNSTELVCDKIIPLIFIQLYCFKTHSGLLEYKNWNPHGLLLVAPYP